MHLFPMFLVLVFLAPCLAWQKDPVPVKVVMEPVSDSGVIVGGVLGQALNASQHGRLRTFINGESSQPIEIFRRDKKDANYEGDWNGEHAGKWLYTAARAAHRTGDAELTANVRKVADFLVALQEPNGYLGTYASTASSRFTAPGVGSSRSWDIWVHSYVIMGLLEVNRYYPDPRYLNAARKIGDLCWRTIVQEGRDITAMGNHFGLSSTVLVEPAVDLYRATGEHRYLELAEKLTAQMNARPELRLLDRSSRGEDPQTIGDGKIYQLLWTFDGLLKLGEAGVSVDYRRMAETVWTSVTRSHLTPAGGPWGGVAVDNENFDPKEYFSPYGMVETCSIMSWIHLNRDLLRLSGDAKYADAIENTAYNSLLAAQHPNGNDWSYFTFPNGKWTATYYWACCKSSGALALEELPPLIFGKRDGGISVNLYSPAKATVQTSAGPVRVAIETDYPQQGSVTVVLDPPHAGAFPVFVRIPAWASGATVKASGRQAVGNIAPGSYVRVEGSWRSGDRIRIQLPMRLRIQRKSLEAGHQQFATLSRGPLVYAIQTVGDGRPAEKFRLPVSGAEASFQPCAKPVGGTGLAFCLQNDSGKQSVFVPFYEAGGRDAGNWHSTWFLVDGNNN